MVKIKSRKQLIKKCDDICRTIVHARASCEHCGKQESLQWHHIISREEKKVRWNLDNSLLLCAGCHLYWWHKYPGRALKWLEEQWPGRYDYLELLIQTTPPKIDLEELRENLYNIPWKYY